MEATRRQNHFRDNRRQREAPARSINCPSGLRRMIEGYCHRLAVLAAAGAWTEAERVFCELRETALAKQSSKTLDPYEVDLADTSLAAEVVNALRAIQIFHVGQLAERARTPRGLDP